MPTERTKKRRPKHGPLATVEFSGGRWVRVLTAEGRALAASYLAAYPRPAVILGRRFPGLLRRAIAEYGDDEVQQVAAMGVMNAAGIFDPTRGFEFSTLVMPHVRALVGRMLQNRAGYRAARQLDPTSENAPGWDAVPAPASMPSPYQPDEWNRLLAPLHPRLRRVVLCLLVEELTLEQTGARIGVTRERVRQMYEKAKSRLAEHLVAIRCGA